MRKVQKKYLAGPVSWGLGLGAASLKIPNLVEDEFCMLWRTWKKHLPFKREFLERLHICLTLHHLLDGGRQADVSLMMH